MYVYVYFCSIVNHRQCTDSKKKTLKYIEKNLSETFPPKNCHAHNNDSKIFMM